MPTDNSFDIKQTYNTLAKAQDEGFVDDVIAGLKNSDTEFGNDGKLTTILEFESLTHDLLLALDRNPNNMDITNILLYVTNYLIKNIEKRKNNHGNNNHFSFVSSVTDGAYALRLLSQQIGKNNNYETLENKELFGLWALYNNAVDFSEQIRALYPTYVVENPNKGNSGPNNLCKTPEISFNALNSKYNHD